ncbi:hypothetical protein T4B_13421 [Trichinella pseudospiralis]|uniref:Uncharacterized protein n=1 Tax=Trichinella pseudospiralis TaxID=6337 RepID=A0A0V1GFB3_TRIPS|nr:hypothetical protein T4B_13421 [Trichinella pseudospiralis]
MEFMDWNPALSNQCDLVERRPELGTSRITCRIL